MGWWGLCGVKMMTTLTHYVKADRVVSQLKRMLVFWIWAKRPRHEQTKTKARQMVVPRDTAKVMMMHIVECELTGENVLKVGGYFLFLRVCIVWTRARVIWCRQQESWTRTMFQFNKQRLTTMGGAKANQLSPPFCHLLCVDVCVRRGPLSLSFSPTRITEISCRISSFFFIPAPFLQLVTCRDVIH